MTPRAGPSAEHRAQKASTPRPLRLALSPYHLCTREMPAMAALVLGSSVATLLPKPADGASRDAVKRAANKAPRYLRLMESWRWSAPLWNAGVVASVLDGDDSAAELPAVYEHIRSTPALAPLRPLTGAVGNAARDAYRSLDHLSADILRGGPDPGVNIPVTAALDRFALRHGLCVVRGTTASIAERAEGRMARKVCSFGFPALRRAGGGRVLLLRNDLEPELAALRARLAELADRLAAGGEPAPEGALRSTAAAATKYSQAFETWARDNARGDDENSQRITAGFAAVTAAFIPADAAFRAGCAAARAIEGTNGHTTPREPCPETLFALLVREMNVRPER